MLCVVLQAQVGQEVSEEESAKEPEHDVEAQPLHEDLPSPCHPAGHAEQGSQGEAEASQTGESGKEGTQIEPSPAIIIGRLCMITSFVIRLCNFRELNFELWHVQ